MYNTYIKRLIDFIFALSALLCIGWLLTLVAIGLHFTNKGCGAFFYQTRIGKNEKPFRIIKFKSMTDEKDTEGNLLPDKYRITNIGKFVRKTSIDELPQLINVLKGDMALFGPRPLLPEYLPFYTERERLRHTVRPGISGWAQVNGRNGLTWDQKLDLDVYYVEHLNLLIDVKIFIMTIKNVLTAKNVNITHQEGQGKLNEYRSMIS